jgi:hypothetical protein
MTRLLWIPICAVALLIPVVVLAGGGQGGFDGVVNTLETRYHAHATRIPFLGLISLISRKATHEGVAGLHVAEFDNFSADVDGNELNQIVEEKLGSGWERIIRETNHHGGEQTLIFIHPECRLLISNHNYAALNKQSPGSFLTALLDLTSKDRAKFPVAFQKES